MGPGEAWILLAAASSPQLSRCDGGVTCWRVSCSLKLSEFGISQYSCSRHTVVCEAEPIRPNITEYDKASSKTDASRLKLEGALLCVSGSLWPSSCDWAPG